MKYNCSFALKTMDAKSTITVMGEESSKIIDPNLL